MCDVFISRSTLKGQFCLVQLCLVKATVFSTLLTKPMFREKPKVENNSFIFCLYTCVNCVRSKLKSDPLCISIK
jgi:hypothetical protein